MRNVAPFTANPQPPLWSSLPSSKTVSAHNQSQWWGQLSISSHKRIDPVQHGVAHVCTRTRTQHAHTGTRVLMDSAVRLCPGRSFGKSGTVLYTWALVCSGPAPNGSFMCAAENVSIKCCLLGSCVVEAATTLLSFGFFGHSTSLSDS